jgi:glucokinase
VNDLVQHLVFDVGGTQLRAAVYDSVSGSLSRVTAVAAPSYVRHPDLSWPDLRRELGAAMSRLREVLDPACLIRSVAISFPGPLDEQRRVLAAPTLWGPLGSYPHAFEEDLKEAWPDTRILLLNDVAAAGYRYLRNALDEFCIVTVSTGIGNKVFVAGRPLIGPSSAGGEIGHLQVDSSPSAPACDCGGRGHLGAIASGRGLVAQARRRGANAPAEFSRSILSSVMGLDASTLTAEALARAYAEDDPWASREIEEGAARLGSVFAAIHMAIGTNRFVLIGGLALGLGSRYARAVRAFANARCWRGEDSGLSVVLGEADGHCALFGAGRAAGTCV